MLNSKKQKIILSLIISIAVTVSVVYKYYKSAQKQKIVNLIVANANQCIEKENYDDAIKLYNEALAYKSSTEILNKINIVKKYKKDKLIYFNALKEYNNKNYNNSINILNTIDKDDNKYFPLSQSKIKECKILYIKDIVKRANKKLLNDNLDDANKDLIIALKLDSNNTDVKTLKSNINKKKAVIDKQKKLEQDAIKPLGYLRKKIIGNVIPMYKYSHKPADFYDRLYNFYIGEDEASKDPEIIDFLNTYNNYVLGSVGDSTFDDPDDKLIKPNVMINGKLAYTACSACPSIYFAHGNIHSWWIIDIYGKSYDYFDVKELKPYYINYKNKNDKSNLVGLNGHYFVENNNISKVD